jgi:hypothetical protein
LGDVKRRSTEERAETRCFGLMVNFDVACLSPPATEDKRNTKQVMTQFTSITRSVFIVKRHRPTELKLRGLDTAFFSTNSKITSQAPSIQLFQYAICPFCNKVKALLNYAGLPFESIEVNPITKAEISWCVTFIIVMGSDTHAHYKMLILLPMLLLLASALKVEEVSKGSYCDHRQHVYVLWIQ